MNIVSEIRRPATADGYAKAPGTNVPGADCLSRPAQNARVPGDTVRLSVAMSFAGIASRSLAGAGGEGPALKLLLRATAVLMGKISSPEIAAFHLRGLADEFSAAAGQLEKEGSHQ